MARFRFRVRLSQLVYEKAVAVVEFDHDGDADSARQELAGRLDEVYAADEGNFDWREDYCAGSAGAGVHQVLGEASVEEPTDFVLGEEEDGCDPKTGL